MGSHLGKTGPVGGGFPIGPDDTPAVANIQVAEKSATTVIVLEIAFFVYIGTLSDCIITRFPCNRAKRGHMAHGVPIVRY